MAGRSAFFARSRLWIIVSMTVAATAILVVYRWRTNAVGGISSRRESPPLGKSAMTVSNGIHYLGGLSPSAAYVIETSEGLILVDSGLDSDAKVVKSQIAELKLDRRRVRAILLTHAHGDHTAGAESLRTSTGAKVYAGSGDAAVLRAGQPLEAFFSTFFMPGQSPHPTTVDVELRGGETIAIGDVLVEVIAAPGHTPGSLCYVANVAGIRALFAGDVIMMLRGDEPPRTELDKPLGTYSAYLAPRYRGDASDSLATLRRLRGLPVPDLVLPGHPRADRIPQSPRLSQDRWESLLDGGIRDMEMLLARYAADGADFLDGQPRTLLPGLEYLGDFGGSAVYGFFAASQFFLVNAPGGPGLVEFVNSRLRQLGREATAPAAVLLTACGAEETAGLNELVEKCHLQVVAPASGISRIRELCPAGTIILPPEDLVARGWFPVRLIPVEGRGIAPIAYLLTWAGKTVMFSGRIPVKISQESGERLIADLTRPPGDLRAYFTCLTRLHQEPGPDLWLPSLPVHGQNANLYDREWPREIEENLLVLRSVIARSRPK